MDKKNYFLRNSLSSFSLSKDENLLGNKSNKSYKSNKSHKSYKSNKSNKSNNNYKSNKSNKSEIKNNNFFSDYLNSKFSRNSKEANSKYIVLTSKGPILHNNSDNNKDSNQFLYPRFSDLFSQQINNWGDESKIVNISKDIKIKSSKSNSNDQIVKEEIKENIDNLNLNIKNTKNKKQDKTKKEIKKTKTTDINTFNPNITNFELTEDNNHFLNRKRDNKKPRKTHDKNALDNIYQRIKNAFFDSIFKLANQELFAINGINEISYFVKIPPFLKSLYNNDNFKLALSKKVKELFYIDFKQFNSNKIENQKNNKKSKKIKIDDLKIDEQIEEIQKKYGKANNDNINIINEIEKMKKNINKKEYKMIKDSILMLYKLLFNTYLKDMYLQYINIDNKKKLFENYGSIKTEFDRIRMEKDKDTNYLIKFSGASMNLIFEQEKDKEKKKKKEYFVIS